MIEETCSFSAGTVVVKGMAGAQNVREIFTSDSCEITSPLDRTTRSLGIGTKEIGRISLLPAEVQGVYHL
jgi:hypothetical protein